MADASSISWQIDDQMVCPKCSSTNIILIEYSWDNPEHYDGISEYRCLACDYRQGRWTGKELKLGFIEPRYGRGGEPVPIKDNK